MILYDNYLTYRDAVIEGVLSLTRQLLSILRCCYTGCVILDLTVIETTEMMLYRACYLKHQEIWVLGDLSNRQFGYRIV